MRSFNKISGIYKTILLLLFLCIFRPIVHAQITSILKSPQYFSASYYHGALFPHHPGLQYFVDRPVHGVSLRYGFYPAENSIGSKKSRTGIGVFHSGLGNPNIYGNASALYIFIEKPVFNPLPALSFNISGGTGLGYLNKPFDIEDNYFNRAIGSHLNLYAHIELKLDFKIYNSIYIPIGVAFTHFSNGNIKMPNFGLNHITMNTGLKYHFQQHDNVQTGYGKPDNNTRNRQEIALVYAGGLRQASRKIDQTWFTSSLMLDYSRSVGKNRLAGGMDLFYNPTFAQDSYYAEGKYTGEETYLQAGIHLGYEIVSGRLSFILQPGVYIYNTTRPSYISYNRIGFRYQFTESWVANLTMKAHGLTIADYFEWGFGYVFKVGRGSNDKVGSRK